MAEEYKNETGDSGTSTLAVAVAEKIAKMKYIILAVAVVVVVIVVFFSHQRRQKASREALAETAVYQDEINMATKPEADATAVFAKAAKEYAGLPAGVRAAVLRFSLAYNKGEYAEAEQAARDFLRAYPNNFLAARFRLALGQTLFALGKTSEAEAVFRELTGTPGSDVFPEAKLSLAQTLEHMATAAKDNPEEYRRRLEAAEAEYNDIIVRSQISIPAQRGFWPPVVILQADFSLTVIRDKLAGYQHPVPAVARAEGATAAAAPTPAAAPAAPVAVPAAPEATPAPAQEQQAPEAEKKTDATPEAK